MQAAANLNRRNGDWNGEVEKRKEWGIEFSNDIEKRLGEAALNIFIQPWWLHKAHKRYQGVTQQWRLQIIPSENKWAHQWEQLP